MSVRSNLDFYKLSQEVKDIFQDASSHGFDVKAMKSILKLKKLDKDKLAEQDAMLELIEIL